MFPNKGQRNINRTYVKSEKQRKRKLVEAKEDYSCVKLIANRKPGKAVWARPHHKQFSIGLAKTGKKGLLIDADGNGSLTAKFRLYKSRTVLEVTLETIMGN